MPESALRELRSAACLAKTVLLALDFAVVTAKQSGLLEGGAKIRINLNKRSGDSESERVALSGGASTFEGCRDVVASLEFGQLERLNDSKAM